MAAAAKMDELLVSWLSSDSVYENILSLMESYRSKTIHGSNSSNHSSSHNSNGNGNNNSNNIIKKSPPSSPSSMFLSKQRKELSNSSHIPHPGHSHESKEPLNNTYDATVVATTAAISIPPFYRPPGMTLPPIRRKSIESDQSWDGIYSSQNQNTSSTTNLQSPEISLLDHTNPSSSLPSTPILLLPIKEQVKKIFQEHAVIVSDSKVLTLDNFVKITKDICQFPTFFNRPLYKRILYLWNVRNITKESQRRILWEEFEKPETLSKLGTMTTALVGGIEKEYHGQKAGTNPKGNDQELLQHLDKYITFEIFQWFWKMEMQDYDMEERFYRLLKRPMDDFVGKDSFLPFLQELLNDHPGLEFLSNHAEFQDKYALTVITRIFYSVNRCHSGRITLRQIKRSDLLSAFHQVDEEEDINKVTRYFSYEHFYVLYCRFWELDHDRDYKITREDLLKYGDQSLSHMIVDRIFDAAPRPFGPPDVTLGEEEGKDAMKDKGGKKSVKALSPKDYLTYEDFIFFMLSEEDKANEISVRYWFHCIDVDGDGKLNNMEMRSFYALQQRRMQQLGQENIPFEDMLCQMIDMIKPKNESYFVVEDFLQEECRSVSGALFDALFNLNKYLSFEQRDPFQERQKREDEFETDWDRFACMDYNRLAMEEEAREEDAMEIDWVSVDDDDDDGGDFSMGLSGSNEAPF